MLAGGIHGAVSSNLWKINIPNTNQKASVLQDIIDLYFPWDGNLGEIPDHPRFFFNATLLETGKPFVLTQRPLNLLVQGGEYAQTARLDLQAIDDKHGGLDANLKRSLKPLHATTLEEINSSAASTPLAYAVMASAAFPILMEPLEFMKYGVIPTQGDIYRTNDRLHLSDGGLYDNSGLDSLIDIVTYLKSGIESPLSVPCKTKNIIIISINADADGYDLNYRIASNKK